MNPHPSYVRVFLTFARNSLVRDMTFRGNFITSTLSSMTWVFMNLGFYILIFRYTPMLGANTGWGQYQFFLFLATTLVINSLVHAFFMTGAEEFSELIRTGNLDFVLLKPIDTQFLISLGRIEWSALGNFFLGVLLMAYAFSKLDYRPGPVQVLLYPVYVLCGLAILYSLMMAMAASSVWLVRNQSVFHFWFYITNFSRYPMEIYRGPVGTPLRLFFTFIIPVLVVVNVPAQMLVRPLEPKTAEQWVLPFFAVVAGVASLVASRWVFKWALRSYRSASS